VINGPAFDQTWDVALARTTTLTHPHSIAFDASLESAYVAMRGTAPKYDDAGIVALAARPMTDDSSGGLHAELWVVSQEDDAVRIVDLATNTVRAPLAIGGTGAPVAIRFSSDGKKAYVASSGVVGERSAISVFDATTKQMIGTYATGSGTSSFVLSDDDQTMWVANSIANTVEAIDLGASDPTYAVRTLATGVPGANAIALEKYDVVVLAPGAGKIEFLRPTGELEKRLAFPGAPTQLAISPTCVDGYAIDPMMGFFDIKTPRMADGTPDYAEYRVPLPTLDLMGMSPVGLVVKPAPPAL
jgi:hypothetical protein